MSDPRLVDIEPGGESTQYESIKEFTIPPAKQTGQLGDHEPHTKSEQWPSKETAPKPEDEDAEWARKMGKEYTSSGLNTTENGRTFNAQASDAEAARSRRQQGYGPGSGVGA
ncbi:hypothetical protein BDW42DRAFT_191223 [Aspergillus taichungensis]|uniref:Uncharacterized protein n=1 Tax=Aspergillus taichungensis TaxID=482145 RepID=A0A2J5I542_9EURO|nr:hypothetical protein BDW42DRAFT_191223 [Aspergillus taichungensis]